MTIRKILIIKMVRAIIETHTAEGLFVRLNFKSFREKSCGS